jgi:transcriptional regulator with XRE-family HTH domain
MRSLDQVIAELPAAQRAEVLARSRALIAEEIALGNLRKARKLTQERLAVLLGLGQDGVSRIESRSDMLLSTLRSYIEAMGGKLRLVVEFRDGVAELSSIGESEKPATKSRPSRAKKPALAPGFAGAKRANTQSARLVRPSR